jgi:hypothetical protein
MSRSAPPSPQHLKLGQHCFGDLVRVELAGKGKLHNPDRHELEGRPRPSALAGRVAWCRPSVFERAKAGSRWRAYSRPVPPPLRIVSHASRTHNEPIILQEAHTSLRALLIAASVGRSGGSESQITAVPATRRRAASGGPPRSSIRPAVEAPPGAAPSHPPSRRRPA